LFQNTSAPCHLFDKSIPHPNATSDKTQLSRCVGSELMQRSLYDAVPSGVTGSNFWWRGGALRQRYRFDDLPRPPCLLDHSDTSIVLVSDLKLSGTKTSAALARRCRHSA
jgi:hypothetical protein